MAVSYSDFLKKVAERAGQEEGITTKKLEAIIKTILDEAKSKGSYTLEGFGVFTITDGTLSFTPNEDLSIEVNYKYAGMTPIQIMPAYVKKAQDDEQKKADEKQHTAKKEKSAIDRLAEVAADAKAKKEKDIKKEQQETEKKEATPEVKKPESPAKPKTEQAIKPSPVEKPKPEKKDVFSQPATHEKPAAEKKKEQAPEKTKSGNLAKAIIGVAATLLLALFIYWLVQTSEKPVSQDTTVADTPAETAPPVTTQEPVQQPVASTQGVRQPEPAAAPPAAPEQYGLRGGLSSVSDYYTIVVISYRSSNRAQNLFNNLISDGWRATLHSATAGETTNHRVGIGQFPTVSAAQNAVANLPEPYRSEHFISRVR